MARFYGRGPVGGASADRASIVVKVPDGSRVAVEVTAEVSAALEVMQREAWRIERREARHTLSLDAMAPPAVPPDSAPDPLSLLVRRCDRERLAAALARFPAVQLRRLLMRAVAQLSIGEIARREGCSERAVKYNLARARKYMKEILSEGFPS